MPISRRDFLKITGSGALLLALSEVWRRNGADIALESEDFTITGVLRGRLRNSSRSSDLFFHSLVQHTLDDAHQWQMADIPLAFTPDKTLILKTAEGIAFATLIFLALERLNNPAPMQRLRPEVLRGLDAHLQSWAAYRQIRPGLLKALEYRPPKSKNMLWGALGGAAAANAFSGIANIAIDKSAAAIGGTPIHGAIASRNIFESLAFVALPPFFVEQVSLGRRAQPKLVYGSAAAPYAVLHTFEAVANSGAQTFAVHVLHLPQPEKCSVRYVHAAATSPSPNTPALAANLHLMAETQPNQAVPLRAIGHHTDPAVDWLDRRDPDSLTARWRANFLALGVHNTPDGIGVSAPDGQLLAFAPLSWAGGAASNFGAQVLARRALLPSEYNAFAMKGAVWTPALTARLPQKALINDLIERRPLWRDLWTGATSIEYNPPNATTQRALQIYDDRVEVLASEEAENLLAQIALRATAGSTQDAENLRAVTLIRSGVIVFPGEIPISRVDDENINDKSAIHWMVVKDGRIQAFVIGLQTARFEYALEIPFVSRLLEEVGIAWDFLIDCDEHTAGQLLLPYATTWVR
ncbi:MAG: hypothetical protein OHK0052_27870 [Anaerolineales bacterium]